MEWVIIMVKEHDNNEKLTEALKLLEEAAREKQDDLRRLVSDKYTHLKSAIGDTEHTVIESLAAAGKRTLEETRHAKDAGAEKIKQASTAIDAHVHALPWPYVGGTALAALLFGYILGRKK